jgi:hypothetical protein
MSFFVRLSRAEDWRVNLAQPDKQWKKGYSARALAYCWMEAKGFPSSVKEVFQKSGHIVFRNADFLAGFVEHKVPLCGGGHPSQNDLFVLAKNKNGLIAIAVEGKVSEPFGETIEDWLINETKGKKARLDSMCKLLKLNQENILQIRYQLLHRTASALIEAERFSASTALMLVHSFSHKNEWFDDYCNFALLFNITAQPNIIHSAGRINDVNLYLAWITGEQEYLNK